ncbi:MAG: hypothetical protein ACT6RF_13975 [Allorhizobium sp.]|uniref:hypothetical protein n=1 Tax=Allorhizobium sp. TaxID=633478 RepID=UPI004034365F
MPADHQIPLELTRFGAPTTLELSSIIVRLPIVLPGLLFAGSIFLICGLCFWQIGLIATPRDID